MKKKLTSVLVALTLMLTILPNIAVHAMTSQEGAQWALDRVGQSIDTDGYYGAQCKDFVNAYCQQNWGFTPPGNAINLKDYNYPSGWQKIQNTPDFLPQPGDIAVWAYGSYATYGHCGIIISANLSTFVSVDQNWYNANGTTGSPAAKVTHNYSGFWGVIRPPFDGSTPVVKAIHQDNNYHVRNGFFTFKNASSGKFMNLYAGTDSNSTAITTWDYDDSTDEQFNIQKKGNGQYKLYPYGSSQGHGRVVDVRCGSDAPAEGDLIELWDDNDDTAQLFYIWPVGDNEYVFELASKDGYVISPTNSSTANSNGTQLILQKYTGASYQKWKFCNNNGKETAANVDYGTGSYKVDTGGIVLRLRSGPSTTYSQVSSVNDGSVLRITQVSDNWGYTSHNGTDGWICLDYTVYTVTLDSISVSQRPNKTSYYVGENFDSSGMQISANYSSGQSETISSGFDISCDLSSAGTKTVTVSYKGQTTTFTVEVKEASVSSIALYSTDIKKEYKIGDALDTGDLKLLVNYDSGTDSIISSGYTTDYDFSTVGTKTVTVSYGGKSTSYEVSVVEPQSTSTALWQIKSVAAVAGSTASVPVILTAENVYDGNITVQYDNTKLEIADVKVGSKLSGHSVSINKEYADNQIRVAFAGTSSFSSTGEIITLTFNVSANAEGTAEISVAASKLYDVSGASMTVESTAGAVTIAPNAEDITVSNIQSETSNGKKVVTATVSSDSVYGYLTRYENGILIECDTAQPENGTVTLSVSDGDGQFKFMVWNALMQPVMNPKNIY